MADKPELPRNAELAGKVIDAQGRERGMLGNVFGTRDHAPTNVVAVSIVILLALLGALLFAPLAEGVDRGSLITAVLSAITFALGLLFGKSSS